MKLISKGGKCSGNYQEYWMHVGTGQVAVLLASKLYWMKEYWRVRVWPPLPWHGHRMLSPHVPVGKAERPRLNHRKLLLCNHIFFSKKSQL